MALLGKHVELAQWLQTVGLNKPKRYDVMKRVLTELDLELVTHYLKWRLDDDMDWKKFMSEAANAGRMDVCLYISKFSDNNVDLLDIGYVATRKAIIQSRSLNRDQWFFLLPKERKESESFWNLVGRDAAKDNNVEMLKWLNSRSILVVNNEDLLHEAIKHRAKDVLLWLPKDWSVRCIQWSTSLDAEFVKNFIWPYIKQDGHQYTRVFTSLISIMFRIMREGDPNLFKFYMAKFTKRWKYEFGQCMAMVHETGFDPDVHLLEPLLQEDVEPFDFVEACKTATARGNFIEIWSIVMQDVPVHIIPRLYLECMKCVADYTHFVFFKTFLDVCDGVDGDERGFAYQHAYLNCIRKEDLTAIRLESQWAPEWEDFDDEIVSVLITTLKNDWTYALAEILFRWPMAFHEQMWSILMCSPKLNATTVGLVYRYVGHVTPLRCSHMMHSLCFKYLDDETFDFVVDNAVDKINMEDALALARSACINHGNGVILEHLLSKL